MRLCDLGRMINSTILLLLLHSTAALSIPIDSVYHKGGARIEADDDVITFPVGVLGLVIDTADCGACNFPAWRFVGNLKIDSVVYVDSVSPLTEESQMTGVVVTSTEFISVLETVKSVRLEKTFKYSIPDDTLYWSSVRQKWIEIPDLSRHYHFMYDSLITIDSVNVLLNSVPNLISFGGIPISYQDGIFDEAILAP